MTLGLVTSEPCPSHQKQRRSELWIDRMRTDTLHIPYGQPVLGPVTGDEQKNMPRL